MQTIESVTLEPIDPVQVSTRFSEILHCLQIRCVDDAIMGCPPGLDGFSVRTDAETLVVASDRGEKIFSLRKQPISVAKAVVRYISRTLAKDQRPALENALWFAWTESFVRLRDERHDHYVYADELTTRQARRRGKSFTPGVIPYVDPDHVLVAEVLDPDLAAAGLKPGATILALDDHTEQQRIIDAWLSPEPGHYTLEVRHNGAEHSYRALRQPERHPSLSWARLESAVYLRVEYFSRDTLVELRRMARKLSKDPPIGVIVDLRSNSGGVANFAVVDCFFKPGTEIVTSQGAHEDKPHTITASFEYYPWRLVVLVDRNTASMAEVFTAAIKKHTRGIVIGEGTFGKAVSQTGYEISDEGELWLVNHHLYYPGTTNTWNHTGIEPDEVITVDDHGRDRIAERLNTAILDLETQTLEDPVLARALDILKSEKKP